MFNSAAIFLTGTMGEIDESKAGASLQLEIVSWNCFCRKVYSFSERKEVDPSKLDRPRTKCCQDVEPQRRCRRWRAFRRR